MLLKGKVRIISILFLVFFFSVNAHAAIIDWRKKESKKTTKKTGPAFDFRKKAKAKTTRTENRKTTKKTGPVFDFRKKPSKAKAAPVKVKKTTKKTGPAFDFRKKAKAKTTRTEIKEPSKKTGPIIDWRKKASTSRTKAMLDKRLRDLTPPSGLKESKLLNQKRIQLSWGTDVRYDDNIYLTEDNEKEDFITTLSPSIAGYLGNEEYTLFGFYNPEMLIYSDYNDKATHADHALGVRAELFKTARIKVKIGDTLRYTENAATSEIEPFVQKTENDFNTNVKFDISEKVSTAFTYEQGTQYYVTNDYKRYNHITHLVSPGLYYHLSPKTSITAEYNLGAVYYTGEKDYNSIFHQIRGGIQGYLTPKSTIFLKAGYQFRTYEDINDDTDALVLEGVYTYKLSPKTIVELRGLGGINESTYQNVEYYKTWNAYASINHSIWRNLEGSISGFFIWNDYPHETSGVREKREDILYGGGARLNYHIRKWLSVYAAYDVKTKRSNINGFDYLNNIISGGANIIF